MPIRLRSAASRLFDRSATVVPARLRAILARRLLSGLPPPQQYQLGLSSMGASLLNLARNGYRPELIVDVGAHQGEWTLLAAGLFPEARAVMAEAESKWEPQLRAVAAALRGRAGVNIALLGPQPTTDAVFHSTGGMGSSMFEELTSEPRVVKHLPMQTLDDLVASAGTPAGSLLLKLDVQGYELEVLRGGAQTLLMTDVIVAELSLIEYNRGAPLMPEVIAYLDQHGFVPYDIAGLVRRHEDAALFQIDMVFTRKEHALRSHRAFLKHA